jgi:transcriptional regulator with XRE-family HTH domain
MSILHTEAQRSTARPFNHGQSNLAPCATVPNIARVTQPSQDVRRQVKAARGERDWTQKDLAQAARVSRGSVQNLENGIRLDETTEAKIARALGKPADWLDTIRTGRGEGEVHPPAQPGARFDPETGTVGDLRRELAYFHRRFRETPEDYGRLLDLLDLYYRLELPDSTDTQGGLGMSAES